MFLALNEWRCAIGIAFQVLYVCVYQTLSRLHKLLLMSSSHKKLKNVSAASCTAKKITVLPAKIKMIY